MPWWGWLIIILVVAIATGIVVWVLARKSTAAQLLDREELAKVKAETLRAELAAEKRAAAKVKEQAAELARRLRANQQWYEKARRSLTKGVRDEYERLAGDPAALDAKLAELLADEEPTNPS